MGSPRVLKLADQIKVIVAEMLERRIKDPRLGFLTVTDVRLTGDSRDATVFYTVLGSEEDHARTAAALRSATGVIRAQVGHSWPQVHPDDRVRAGRRAREREAIDDLRARRGRLTRGWPNSCRGGVRGRGRSVQAR